MKLTVIFDLDGTLIDTHSGIIETYTVALKCLGVVNKDNSAIRATIGLPLEQGFSNLLGVDLVSDEVIQGVTLYHTLYKDIILAKAKELIFPGVVKGLEILKNDGFSLAIATINTHARAEALLKSADIWKYFNVIIGVDEVTQPKPHPEMTNLIIKKLGVLVEHTIMVGDSAHDIQMANSCGICSIAVTYGIHDIHKLQLAKPTWIVDTFDDVVNCLQQKF